MCYEKNYKLLDVSTATSYTNTDIDRYNTKNITKAYDNDIHR